jgi:hypothetical protein
VTEKLDQRSRDALLAKEDPASMPVNVSKRIWRAITNHVYGNT